MANPDCTLYRVEVSATERGRDYWATRSWSNSQTADAVRSADVVLVPWENFREEKLALFPQGSSDVFRILRSELANHQIAVAIDRSQYEEIALHSNELRLPTILVTALVLPTLAQIIGNRLDRWLPGDSPNATVETEIIVEGERGRCISIKYKGPKDKFLETIAVQTERCLARVPQHEPRRRFEPETTQRKPKRASGAR